jgi:hypothetical protein
MTYKTQIQNENISGVKTFNEGIAVSLGGAVISEYVPNTDVPFNAGMFVSNGGTWTVASGHVLGFTYSIIGKMMFISLRIDGSSATGSASTLRITLPAGKTTSANCQMIDTCICSNTNTTNVVGMVQAAPNITYVGIYRNIIGSLWDAGSVGMNVVFAVPIA